MSTIFRVAFCTLVLFFSLSVHADCGRLQINKGFDIVFRITDVKKVEQVILQKHNKKTEKILWSNKPGDAAEIKDGLTEKNQNHEIWLRYTPGKSNPQKGKVSVSFYREDLSSPGWYQAMETSVDISGLSNNVYVAGNHVEILSCDGSDEPVFNNPPAETNYCEYFTGPAQTWSNKGKADIVSNAVIEGAVGGQYLGFNTVQSKKNSCGKNTRCLSNNSYPDKDLLVDRPPFESFEVKNNGKEFKLNKEVTLQPGHYEKVEILNKAKVNLLPGKYRVGEFIVKGNSQLKISGAVKLDVNKFSLLDNAVIHHTGAPKNFVVMAHEKGGDIEFSTTKKTVFNAFVFAKGTASILKNTQINGAVTAYNLKMDGNAKLTAALGDCSIEPPPDFDYCELFPGPLQTWKPNPSDSLNIETGATVYGTQSVGGKHFVGFNNLSGENLAKGCDEQQCYSGDSLFVEPASLGAFPNNIPNEIYPVNHSTTFNENVHGRLGAVTVNERVVLTINSGTYWYDSLNILGKVIIPKGQKVIIHTKALALSLNSQFIVEDGVSLDSLLIFVHEKPPVAPLMIHPKVDFNSGSLFRGLIYSERLTELSNNVNYYGALTALNVNMHNHSTIHGNSACFSPKKEYAITIEPEVNISLTCDMQEIEFQVRNGNELAKNFDGSIEVTTNIFQAGKGQWYQAQGAARDISKPLTLYPQDGIARLSLKSDWVGKIQVTGRIIDDDATPAIGNFSFVPFKFEVAESALPVVAGKPRDITITAKSCRDAASKAVAVGYSGKRTLELSTSYAAPARGGHKVELRACNKASKNAACKEPPASDWQDSGIELDFKQGIATAKLRYLDAGRTVLQIADPECSLEKGCEIVGKSYSASTTALGDWQRLEGSQTVYSRPYTFALCDIQSASGKTVFSGTSKQGDGFAAAGEKFSVSFKPVIWQQGLDNSGGMITTGSRWCQVPTTPNYYSVDKLISAPLKLSHRLDTPSGGEKGELYGAGTYSFKTRQEASQGLLLDNLSWSEVGSLRLQADATYLGMDVAQGAGVLGRFYPHHFALKSSELVDAVANTFTYMDQAFSASFEVEAQNKAGVATLNYGDFAADYQDKLALVAVDGGVVGSGKNELTPRLDKGGLPSEWAKKWIKARLEVNNALVGFKREVTRPLPKTTTPDGPYDVRVGLVVEKETAKKERIDCDARGCTDFANQDLDIREANGVTPVKATALAGNITARYGRLKLDDVNSQFDKSVNIPLQAQYWDSSVNAFIPNTDDSLSEFDGSNYCKQVIWPTEPKEAEKSRSLMQGNGTVSRGESYLLEATPDRSDYFREQVRFWLRLAKSPQSNESGILNCKAVDAPIGGTYYRPWLQYNWRGKGDEDPSAIVTFGVYRGNDRIIYRGEKGVNHLLN